LVAIPEVAAGCTTIGALWRGDRGRGAEEWGKFVGRVRDAALSAVFDEVAAKSGTYFWSAIRFSADPCMINVSP